MASNSSGPGVPPVGILGTGSYLPARRVGNTEAGAAAGVDDAWIRARTGIRNRHWAAGEEATSDLAVAAARDALVAAGVAAGDLGHVILATSTPDAPQPPTACTVAARLGTPPATAAFDINAVCSGFVVALGLGHALFSAGDPRPVLVVGADIYSRSLDLSDRRTAVLFGDGAGAAVLGPVAAGRGIRASRLLTFGEQRELIGVVAGGTRLPATAETLDKGLHFFTMNGRAVREFVLDRIPAAVADFLASAGVAPHEIRHVVPHQANAKLVTDLFGRLGLPEARLHLSADEQGNTGAASVPATLDAAARAGNLRPGDLVLLVGFGGGMAAGLCLLHW